MDQLLEKQSGITEDALMSEYPKILMVDDKPENLIALERLLRDLPVKLYKADNGNDALRLTLHNEFALALLDIQMPEMDGYELAELLRQEEKTAEMPFIFISAIYTDSINIFQGYEKGAFSYLTKPFEPKVLLAKVHFFIDKHRKEKALEAKTRQLETINKELEAATQAKSTFLAKMSHEIRTPMNAIIGFSHLIQRTELNEKQVDYVRKIESSSQNLLGIINDILDFSKIEAGKLTLEDIEFDIEEVFQDLANIVTYKAHEKGVEIVFGLDSQLPNYLIGDPLRLGQILINLVNNAIKFTDEGEIVIKADLISETKDEAVIQFSVKDSGIGIKKEKIPMLFESFTQADTTTSRKFGGTGLGLTISKNLVEMMNGTIWAESEFGQGSEFMFTVELKKQKDATLQLVPTIDLRGLKVLVVDDNEAARNIIQNALESFTFDVTTVDSGKKAIELLSKSSNSPYELILMDWKMPEMDGLEASEIILKNKNINNPPLIVMVSAYGNDEAYAKSEQLGISSFLDKPIKYSLLFDTIMNLFGKSVSRESFKDRGLKEVAGGLEKIRGARILLAEDNEINQQVATELLEGAGFDITIASNGLEVLEQLKSNESFDVILMDLQMPEMDGYEATISIRKIKKFNELPVIAMTADAIGGVREECLKIGMNDFVTKPINPSELFKALLNWVKSGDRDFNIVAKEPVEIVEFPEIDGINIEEGLARVGGNKKLYLNLLRNFAEGNESLISEVSEVLKADNLEQAERLIHTLKGTSGNLGMTAVHSETIKLEKLMKENGWDDFADLGTPLKDELTNLIGQLKGALLNLNQDDPTKEFTPEKINQLMELLKNDDPEAMDLLESMGSTEHPLFDELKEKVTNYEFEEASKLLSRLSADLKKHTE
ncbi:MAG: response regulator [Bacteroidota bacterium]